MRSEEYAIDNFVAKLKIVAEEKEFGVCFGHHLFIESMHSIMIMDYEVC